MIDDPQNRLKKLTARHQEVLGMVCEGVEYRQIAEELVISENTVRAHMAEIYQRLGLTELSRQERIATLFNVFCPILNEEITPAPVSNEPEVIPREVEAMVEEDEKAMVVFRQQSLRPMAEPDAGERPPAGRRTRSGCFLAGAVLGLLLVVAALYYLFGIVLPGQSLDGIGETATAIQAATDAVVLATTASPPTITPTLAYTETIEPSATFTISPTFTMTPTFTFTATATPLTDTSAGSLLQIGEWWREDGVWLRVSDYELSPQGDIKIVMELWNKTGDTLVFSWHPSGNFSLVDNTGHRYPLYFTYQSGTTMNEIIEADELTLIRLHQYETALHYEDEYVFNANVTELLLTVVSFSRIDQAEFRITLNK